jgi:hypothetical protein
MNEFVVFYAWQSDTFQKNNRFLIREALDLAAKSISEKSSGCTVRIDSDTEGALGHVLVTETILKKIADCDAFVPDLTFVAETSGAKLVPNPNVLLEYGYARGVKSPSIMIPVMNIAYGSPDKLPFDMAHQRFPLQFDLNKSASSSDRRAVEKKLAKEFEDILLLMIEAALPKPVEPKPFSAVVPARPPTFYFPVGQSLASSGLPGEQEYTFEGLRAIYLRLYPKFEQPNVGWAKLEDIFCQRRRVNSMSPQWNGLSARNKYGCVTLDIEADGTTLGITQGFPTGELWGINSKVFRNAASLDFSSDKRKFLGAISAEKLYSRALEHYLEVATTEMNLQFPFIVELGASGLESVYLGAPHPEVSSVHYYGPIHVPSLVRQFEIRDANPDSVMGILRLYFEELYDLAGCVRDKILTDEYVKQNDIPALGGAR